MQESTKLQFEQIFVKHYERLTNSRQTVGGLPFTLENIVCFILFGGRELDIEDVYGDVSDRYSMETFLADAREAGIETDEHLKKAVEELVAIKFLHLQPDGCYYSYQATRETARMLNRVYPKMLGINMLAYIGQTVQEVESGRIDLAAGLARFDQTLQKQGVPLPKPKIPVIAPAPKPTVPIKKAEDLKPGNKRIFRDYIVADAVKAKVERSIFQDDPEDDPLEAMALAAFEEPPEIPEEDAGVSVTPPKEQQEVAASRQPLPVAEAEMVVDDEEIAARIAAFENQLSLVCPICKTHALKVEKTAAGKLFYSCTSASCNFISWGKPHQIACPSCKNSFMVEVADNAGRLVLKCPRATCQHRQPLASAAPVSRAASTAPAAPASPASGGGGVKKVVRKRLVRRKV